MLFFFQDGQPITCNGNVSIYSFSGGQVTAGPGAGGLQFSQANMSGLSGSQEFNNAAGVPPQYVYPTSPQQSPASPQHGGAPGSPHSPVATTAQQQPLPSPPQQHQPPQPLASPTHTGLVPGSGPPQDQPLSLVQQPQHQQVQQNQQQPQANNKIPDIILTGSTAATLADLEEILSCRESTFHGQYSLT